MRIKIVPDPPDDPSTIRRMQRAVPLVPDSEEDCCARLMARFDIPSPDEARAWLTFLRGLGLVEEHTRGFARTRRTPDRAFLVDALRNDIYGVEEILAILEQADRPIPTETVFERFEQHVPPWERHRDPGSWQTRWCDRVADLLEWLVLFDLVERTETGVRRS